MGEEAGAGACAGWFAHDRRSPWRFRGSECLQTQRLQVAEHDHLGLQRSRDQQIRHRDQHGEESLERREPAGQLHHGIELLEREGTRARVERCRRLLRGHHGHLFEWEMVWPGPSHLERHGLLLAHFEPVAHGRCPRVWPRPRPGPRHPYV